jgi:hypothetical protein
MLPSHALLVAKQTVQRERALAKFAVPSDNYDERMSVN